MLSFAKGNISAGESSLVFDRIFGKAGIVEEETYYSPMEGINKFEQIGKAWQNSMVSKGPSIEATTGSTYTAYSLFPAFVDPSIVDKTMRETPLVKLLPRKAVRGRAYVYNIVSAKGGAKFLADDSSLSDQVDTRSNATVVLKYLYAVGRVTGPAMAEASSYINLLAEDLRVKTASINEALENEIINGSTSTDPLGFNGLLTTISTNSTSNSGARLTLEQFRTDVNTCFEANGIVDLAVTDGQTHAYLKGLLMDFQHNIERPSGKMDFGIPDAFMIDGVLVIKDRYMPTTAASRKIMYLDTRYIFLAVLQDVTYTEVGIVNDSSKYFLKWYGALVVTFESAMAQRTSLA